MPSTPRRASSRSHCALFLLSLLVGCAASARERGAVEVAESYRDWLDGPGRQWVADGAARGQDVALDRQAAWDVSRALVERFLSAKENDDAEHPRQQ